MVVFTVVLPIFAIALAGYLFARLGRFSQADTNGLMRYVFDFAIPALLFDSLANMKWPAHLDWAFMFSYYLVVLVIFGLAMWISRRRFGYTRVEQAVFGIGSVYSNTVFVGLPVVLAAYGQEGTLPLLMIITVHVAFMSLLVTIFAEAGSLQSGGLIRILASLLRSLAMNPLIVSLAAGALVNILRIPLPAPLTSAIGLVSKSASPTALFVLGASLSQFKVRDHVQEAWVIVGLKNVLQPLLVGLLVFWIFRVDYQWGSVAVLTAGLPVGINASMFAYKYRAKVSSVSAATLLSTVIAVASLSLLLFILKGH